MKLLKELHEMSSHEKDLISKIYNEKQIEYDVEKKSFLLDFDLLTPFLKENLASSNVISLMLKSEIVATGPKIFSFSSRVCESLEEIELTLNCMDYKQPFPTFCFDFPEDYCTNRLIPSDNEDISNWDSTHFPYYAVIKHDEERNLIWVYVLMSSGYSLTRFFSLKENLTLEECFMGVRDIVAGEHEDLLNELEKKMTDRIIRIMCNTALLSVNYGFEKKYDEVKEKMIKKLDKCPEKFRSKMKFDILTRPDIYNFNQNITLFHTSNESNCSSNNTGINVKPHWRKCHWRNQPYGEKLSLRKKIMIPPVFINAEMFSGNLSNTKVIYTQKAL